MKLKETQAGKDPHVFLWLHACDSFEHYLLAQGGQQLSSGAKMQPAPCAASGSA